MEPAARGFRVQGSAIDWGFRLRVKAGWLRTEYVTPGIRVSGRELRIEDLGSRIEGAGLRIWGSGHRVRGLEERQVAKGKISLFSLAKAHPSFVGEAQERGGVGRGELRAPPREKPRGRSYMKSEID